jgi:hypothetical protein
VVVTACIVVVEPPAVVLVEPMTVVLVVLLVVLEVLLLVLLLELLVVVGGPFQQKDTWLMESFGDASPVPTVVGGSKR